MGLADNNLIKKANELLNLVPSVEPEHKQEIARAEALLESCEKRLLDVLRCKINSLEPPWLSGAERYSAQLAVYSDPERKCLLKKIYDLKLEEFKMLRYTVNGKTMGPTTHEAEVCKKKQT